MPDSKQLREDIEYVRAAAERSKPSPVSAIYLLWALFGFCGFAMVDFVGELRWVGIYWLFAGPVGFVLSMWLGMRANHDAGLRNRAEGTRHGLHWLAFMRRVSGDDLGTEFRLDRCRPGAGYRPDGLILKGSTEA